VAVAADRGRSRIILVLTCINLVSEFPNASQIIFSLSRCCRKFVDRLANEGRELLVEDRVFLPLLLDYANGGVRYLVRHRGISCSPFGRGLS
jgi:hypothetical protein